MQALSVSASLTWAEKRIGVVRTEELASNVEADVDNFVLDTGVNPENPYLNLVETKSFVEDGPEPGDLNRHGMYCASIIGARGSDEVIGVVPGARIHGLKVLGSSGGGTFSNIIDAVEYVALFKEQNPERRVVVNMSLGSTWPRFD